MHQNQGMTVSSKLPLLLIEKDGRINGRRHTGGDVVCIQDAIKFYALCWHLNGLLTTFSVFYTLRWSSSSFRKLYITFKLSTCAYMTKLAKTTTKLAKPSF